MMGWLVKLRDLNQRWLYLATILLLILPLAVTIPIPSTGVSPATQGLYDMMDSCPKDKVVMIDSSWDMSSRAECQAQLACVVRHLCANKTRFVVTSLGTPFSPDFADKVITPIAEEAGYVYGEDWANTGYIQSAGGMGVVIDGLCRDFHSVRPFSSVMLSVQVSARKSSRRWPMGPEPFQKSTKSSGPEIGGFRPPRNSSLVTSALIPSRAQARS